MTTTSHTVTVPGHGGTDVTVDSHGRGRPFLLLHGGAGPRSVADFARLLADREGARVLTPTHPGFGGTPRPERLDSIAGLAGLYARLLDELGLEDVMVVGNSIGGWIAAELALLDTGRVGGVALVDAVGIHVDGHPVADVFSLTPGELSQLSYHDPAAFRIDPATLTEERRREMAGNLAALAVYGGEPSMTDPTLRSRLAAVTVPTLVLWGDSDRVVDLDYGRAYAAAVPGARFAVLDRAGHVPQIEAPDRLLDRIAEFTAEVAAPSRARDGRRG